MCTLFPIHSSLLHTHLILLLGQTETQKLVQQNAEAAAGRAAVSEQDQQFLRDLEAHPPRTIDGVFVREFAERLQRYPDEVAAFVGVFAVLLQRNRDLAADNVQLIAAIAALKNFVQQNPQ